MPRPVTLFTGQWADLSIDDMCRKASDLGYQGVELACWGDHFEVDKALAEDDYCANKRELLDRYDLQCHAISAHLVGQAICDKTVPSISTASGREGSSCPTSIASRATLIVLATKARRRSSC